MLTPERVLDLQQSAGNAAVQRTLSVQRDEEEASPATAASGGSAPTPAGEAPQRERRNFVFIMGTDPEGSTAYYTRARETYAALIPNPIMVDSARSLDDLFGYLRGRTEVAEQIVIVTHASPDGSMAFPLNAGDTDSRVTYAELVQALVEHPAMFELSGQVDAGTTIRIKGCALGRSERMVETIDRAFGGLGRVIATTHLNTVNQNAIIEYLTGYYTEYPGWVRPPVRQIRQDMQARYPHVPPAAWRPFLRIMRRRQRSQMWIAFASPVPRTERAANRQAPRWFAGTDVASWRKRCIVAMEMPIGNPEHWYFFEVTNPEDRTRDVRTVKVRPPTDERVLAEAHAVSDRPEAYAWRVTRRRIAGERLQVAATGKITQYEVRTNMPIIVRGSGTFSERIHPPESDEQYYTVSTTSETGAPPVGDLPEREAEVAVE